MERAGNSQQTLARNGDGSVAIAVRARSEVVLPPETLLRAQQQTAQMKLLEKAKELQRSARDTPETVLFLPQKDSGLMCRDNPLLPIPQVAISLDPVKFMADFMQESGVTFLGHVEVEEKGKFVKKMKVVYILN